MYDLWSGLYLDVRIYTLEETTTSVSMRMLILDATFNSL